MPDIGHLATPVAFGAFSYLILRTVPETTATVASTERFVDYAQMGFETRMRASAALLSVGADSPVKLLANA
jgi:hypothetical protein